MSLTVPRGFQVGLDLLHGEASVQSILQGCLLVCSSLLEVFGRLGHRHGIGFSLCGRFSLCSLRCLRCGLGRSSLRLLFKDHCRLSGSSGFLIQTFRGRFKLLLGLINR